MKDIITTAAVAYFRVSSEEQKDGYSIDAQKRLILDYAEKRGMLIAKTFEEVETAKRAGRECFAEMLHYLKVNNAIRIILVEKTDRLYRNISDWVSVDNLKNIEIHLVKESEIISADSSSHQKFIHGIKVLMAKNYIDNLSEETKKGMLEKAEQGIWPTVAPLGYLNVESSDGKRIIVPDEAYKGLIKNIFELYVSGQYSVKEVAKKARESGFVSERRSFRLPHSTVNKILRNPVYYGDFVWKGKVYKGTHESIVSKEQWNAAQDLLDARLGNQRKKSKHNFPFSGLIKCSVCNRSLIGDIKKGKYIYYRCGAGKEECKCISYTRQEVFEEKFSNILKQLKFNNEVINWVSRALKENHKDKKLQHQEAIERLQREYSNLDSRIEAMYEDKLDGKIDQALFDKKSAEWRNRQNSILETIHQHQTASQSYIEEGIKLLELASNAYSLFIKQPAKEKRRLLNFILSNCYWDGEHLEVEYKQPFDLIAKTSIENEMLFEGNRSEKANLEKWLPGTGSNRRHGG